MHSTVTKELIFSHFRQEASPLQREMIEQWLREKANEELYYEWLEEWEIQNSQYMPESEEGLLDFMNFISEDSVNGLGEGRPLPASTFLPHSGLSWRMGLSAACLAFLLGAGWLLRGPVLYRTYATAPGETHSFQLADGSTVSLGSKSSLLVPRWGFSRQAREVTLDGKADFSVRHTPDSRKFVVKTAKDFEVVVLGTEFTVFARPRRAKVLLKSGRVRLDYRENQAAKRLIMEPGQLVTLDPKNHPVLKLLADVHPPSIREGDRFIFDETSLEEIAYLLEENYGLRVDIEGPALSERLLMGSFRADNVDQLLQSISELLDIDVIRHDNYVLLRENR